MNGPSVEAPMFAPVRVSGNPEAVPVPLVALNQRVTDFPPGVGQRGAGVGQGRIFEAQVSVRFGAKRCQRWCWRPTNGITVDTCQEWTGAVLVPTAGADDRLVRPAVELRAGAAVWSFLVSIVSKKGATVTPGFEFVVDDRDQARRWTPLPPWLMAILGESYAEPVSKGWSRYA